MQLEERRAIIRQLQDSEGQIGALMTMIEGGRPCMQILHQLTLIRARLVEVSARLLIYAVEKSRENLLCNPDQEDRQAELVRLGDLYSIMAQLSISYGVHSHE